MSYRAMLAANSGEPDQQPQEGTETTKKARGRRKKSDETAIAKTAGHEALDANTQAVNNAAVNLAAIQQQLIATNGYQTGQQEAEIHNAAVRAGYHDRATNLTISRIEGLAGMIEDRQKNFNPMDVLADLGFVGDDDDTQKKIQNFQDTDYNKFLL